MILVDTSVWVDHLRKSEHVLEVHLRAGNVAIHPFIIGELAMGNLKPRDGVLSLLGNLPVSTIARESDVLRFVAIEKLYGMGIGYIDAHLLASVQITPGTVIWTRDERLRKIASRLSVAAAER